MCYFITDGNFFQKGANLTKQGRRSFIKTITGTFFLFSFSRPHDAQAEIQNFGILDKTRINKDLHYLDRDANDFPPQQIPFRSSHYRKIFRLESIDSEKLNARFSVSNLTNNLTLESSPLNVDFSFHIHDGKIYFVSEKHELYFFWKPKFGLYMLDNKNLLRIVEHCIPGNHPSYYPSDIRVTFDMKSDDRFYARWTRWSYWKNGGPKSPLKDFDGFAEETLAMDSSEQRDRKVAVGLNTFFNSIPFGLSSLKYIARKSPNSMVGLLEVFIPKVLGWMIGPSKIIEPGKIELSNCPYRKRLGTQVCESTCGHAIGRYFTEDLGVPLRFNPTVNSYTKCQILIGKKQFES